MDGLEISSGQVAPDLDATTCPQPRLFGSQKFLDQGAQAVPILVAAVGLLGLGVLPKRDLGQDLLRGCSCRLGVDHLG